MSSPLVLLDVLLPDFLEAQLRPHCELRPWSVLDGEGAGAQRGAIRGIYTFGHPTVDGAVMDRLPNLLVISNFGVGVDHIDVSAARSRGISVGNTPGAVDGATADMTMGLLLAAARNLVVGDRYARSSAFTHYDPGQLLGAEVFGSTLGIIGMGRIGKQLARRARSFDMEVLYHNRKRDPAAEAELGVSYSDLNGLLERSHFVSLNVPLTDRTRQMIGEAELRKMRRDAILINIARGAVVDHDALHRALAGGWIRAAAIDVTEPEPLPRDHPLLKLDNLVISPHLGSATVRTRERMGEMTVANLLAGLRGEPLPNEVFA